MGDVIEFLPREAYDARRWAKFADEVQEIEQQPRAKPAMTQQELYTLFSESTMTVCSSLIAMYQTTGKWTTECDVRMKRVVQDLLQLCRVLSATSTPIPTPVLTLVGPHFKGDGHDKNAG
jgi:hypothetical protein